MHGEKIPISAVNMLPNLVGVYFFYDEQHQLRYIGKSNNIKKRVQQHLAGKDRKSLKIQQFINYVAFEPMGNELMALLHESDLIKAHQPLYNRSQRRTLFNYGLYTEDIDGYLGLHIQKIKPDSEEIMSFSSMDEAKETLYRITERHHLCQKINGIYKTKGACFQYQIKQCYGACIKAEEIESYNTRVELLLKPFRNNQKTLLLELPGRQEDEKGLVYVENGTYKGFGFCAKGIGGKKRLLYIDPKISNRDTKRILRRYLIQKNL